MFEGIDPIAQVIIAIGILIGIIVIGAIVVRGGITIGKNFFRVGGKKKKNKCDNEPDATLHISDLHIIADIFTDSFKIIFDLNKSIKLQKKMDFAQEKILLIRSLKEKRFYRQINKEGIDWDSISIHPDTQYYVQVLNNAISFDNGEQSLVSTIRKYIRLGSYSLSEKKTDEENKKEYNEFLENVMQVINDRWWRFFNQNYESKFLNKEGIISERDITNADIYKLDFDETHLLEIKDIIKHIFDNAIKEDEIINEQIKILDDKRKEKINNIIRTRQRSKPDENKK